MFFYIYIDGSQWAIRNINANLEGVFVRLSYDKIK